MMCGHNALVHILVVPPRGVTFSGSSQWMALINGLQDAGHHASVLDDDTQQADALVVLNHRSGVAQLQSKLGVPVSNTTLVALEPRVTAPTMFHPRSLRLYGQRFAASTMWAQQINARPFLWPQDLQQPIVKEQTSSFEATLINADKRSAVHGSLYGLRRSVIRALDESSTPLAVFGPGWGETPGERLQQAAKAVMKAARAQIVPKLTEAMSDLSLRPAHWMGTVHSKDEAFAVAPASILIENSSDYVSEKLVDAVCAGVAPLYVGPPLGKFGLPSEIAIECEPRVEHIVTALRQLTAARRAEVISAGRQWLKSADSQKHDIRVVLKDLGSQIGHGLGRPTG